MSEQPGLALQQTMDRYGGGRLRDPRDGRVPRGLVRGAGLSAFGEDPDSSKLWRKSVRNVAGAGVVPLSVGLRRAAVSPRGVGGLLWRVPGRRRRAGLEGAPGRALGVGGRLPRPCGGRGSVDVLVE